MSRQSNVVVIHDKTEPARDVLRHLSQNGRPQTAHMDSIAGDTFKATNIVVLDVDLEDAATLDAVRTGVLARIPLSQPVVMLANQIEQRELIESLGQGRSRAVMRPLDGNRLANTINFLLTECKKWEQDTVAARRERMAVLAPEHREALTAGDEALSSIFAFARGQAPLVASAVKKQGETIIHSLRGGKLANWVNAVRAHHDGTYQHCMLVTGVAVAFGEILCIPKADLQRLTTALLVHDLGKASIPASILDKNGPLTDEERTIMREHPGIGADMLAGAPDIDATIVEVVRHHHEFLDGTGYPDGLRGEQISDLVRIATIADIFGALVEKRAYKPAMGGMQAYDILVSMGDKLDQPLVRVLRAIAKTF